MGSKGINQFPTTTTEDPTDVLHAVRPLVGDVSMERTNVAYKLYSNKVTITSAEVLALNATPQLIVTGVPGKIILPMYIIVDLDGATINYATNLQLTAGSASTIDDTHYTNIGTMPTLLITGTVLFAGFSGGTQITSIVAGDGLYMRVRTGNPTAGDGDLQVAVRYFLADAT